MDLKDDDIFDDEFDEPKRTKWAILVTPNKNSWFITQVEDGIKIGEIDSDLSEKDDIVVGAFFENRVEEFLEAITEIAGGNSIELRQKIEEVLSGVCVSFEEATANLKKWQLPKATKA